jgi:hypothetical protein
MPSAILSNIPPRAGSDLTWCTPPSSPLVERRLATLAAVNAYDPAAWHDFFVGAMGASAALTGLLFVAISINLEQILKFPNLPGRAAGSLSILVAALVVASCGLAPGQSLQALGAEIAVAGSVVAGQAIWVTTRKPEEAGYRVTWRIERIVTMLLPGLVFLAGGLSLIAGGGGGLYWILGAIVLAFVVSAINAWVLLIEVLR